MILICFFIYITQEYSIGSSLSHFDYTLTLDIVMFVIHITSLGVRRHSSKFRHTSCINLEKGEDIIKLQHVNPFMHNVWPFYNIMHERDKCLLLQPRLNKILRKFNFLW